MTRTNQRERPQAEVIAEQVASLFGDDEFAQKLTSFLQESQVVVDEGDLFHDTRLTIRSGRAKYIAIDRAEYDRATGDKIRGGSIFCFVASVNATTKGLGQVTKGDVLKAATWKAPAKHARGNIFDEHNGLRGNDGNTPIRWTGPHYLAG